jgi:hypothetical protein
LKFWSARKGPSQELNNVGNALRGYSSIAGGAAKSHQETNVTGNAVADCAKARQVDEKPFLKD